MAVVPNPSQLSKLSRMSTPDLRIVSLIPSATEIVAALGVGEKLVGRSHECDYPLQVQSLPICTAANLNPEGKSRDIHDQVTMLLQSALSVYRLDLEQLEHLQPTHILTQAQCEVCAVSLAEVEQALAQITHQSIQVISLQPHLLEHIWQDMDRVAAALGCDSQPIIHRLQDRMNQCQQKLQDTDPRPTVACLEWTDPLMIAGNWVPELVTLAGGEPCLGTAGQHSSWLTWEQLLTANPDLIVCMPCGFNLKQAAQAIQELAQKPQWQQLTAVQKQQIYLTDGNQYFNRPGPRLVDSLELLAEIFHPQVFTPRYVGHGWQRLTA